MKDKKKSLKAKVLGFLGVCAMVVTIWAGVTGFTLKDFFSSNKGEPLVSSDLPTTKSSSAQTTSSSSTEPITSDSSTETVETRQTSDSTSDSTSDAKRSSVVDLADLVDFTKEGDWDVDDFLDNENKPHYGWGIDFNKNAFGNWARTGNNVEFLLDKEYSKIKGKICLLYKHRSTEAQARIKIYSDADLVMTSEVITSGIRPLDFDVDIKNCEVLRFEVETLTEDRLEFGIEAKLVK